MNYSPAYFLKIQAWFSPEKFCDTTIYNNT